MPEMRVREKYEVWKYYPVALMALLLPFNVGVAIVIVISLLLFFSLGSVSSGIKKLLNEKWTYLFLFFFLLHCILYFFSSNKPEAYTAIEIKLGFMAFPLLLFTQQFNRIDLRLIMRIFAFSTLACTVFNIGRALYFLLFTGQSDYLYYSKFSFFMHPSYYAMYTVFSIVVLSLTGLNYFNSRLRNMLIVVFSCLVLGIGVFMSASKMGIATLFLVIPVILFYMLYRRKKHKLLIAILLFIGAGTFIAFKLDFGPVQRLKGALNFAGSEKAIDKTTAESNAVRVLIWQEGFKIVKKNPVIGVTPGDANDTLYKAYESNGMTGALEKHLNAHNQYLQTAIGTGFLGLVSLIVLTFGLVIVGILKKDILLILFGIIIVLNFLVESMLQTQAGTLFFVFFAPLLLINASIVNKRY